jgi:alpha-glucosidase
MRQIAPQKVTFQEQNNHKLLFKGNREEYIALSVLEHDIIRVQHYPENNTRLDRTWLLVDDNGAMPREGRNREDVTQFRLPEYQFSQENTAVEVQTDTLRLKIHLGDFRIDWFNNDEALFHQDVERVAYSYNLSGRDVFHYTKRFEGEYYYGFGERSGALSKVGRRMRMLNLDSLGYSSETTDPLYKHCPFYITYNPQLNVAYGLFYDNLSTTTFDMGKEIDAYRGQYRYYHAEDGDLDYYLIYGASIEAVIEKYTKMTGRPALPPKWSLGFLGSTMTYTEAENAQEQLKRFAELCDEHDIPCDLFHLSSGYTTNEQNQRCVFTWNKSRVPDPQQMVDDFHAAGIRLAPNIKPYLLTTHPNYDEVVNRDGFIKAAESDTPQPSTFWAGGVNEMGDGAYLDFTSKAGYNWWQEKLTEQLLDYGIDAAWNDNNEYEIWDDDARCDGFGNAIRIGTARPLNTLLMAHASYHALLKKHPDLRPFVLSRSGAPGIQRYAQIWSGDNNTSWNDLRYGISMSLGSGLSGMPNTGNDVGGFFGEPPSPELLLRWVQNHIFHPRFCIHSWNLDKTVTEPWMYPEVLLQIRAAMNFRYLLIPYLYNLFIEAHKTGHPIIRPLVYHFPDDERCHTESFDFLLGSHLLVSTVIHEGHREKSTYLPKGQHWCDWHTGDWHNGGQEITSPADLNTFPLYVREGGVIPMGKSMRHIGAQPDDERTFYIFPNPNGDDISYTLAEDDGETFAYQRGERTIVTLTVKATSEDVIVSVNVEGNYDLPYKVITVILPQGDNRNLEGGELVTNSERSAIRINLD